jgi:hypothetical protein
VSEQLRRKRTILTYSEIHYVGHTVNLVMAVNEQIGIVEWYTFTLRYQLAIVLIPPVHWLPFVLKTMTVSAPWVPPFHRVRGMVSLPANVFFPLYKQSLRSLQIKPPVKTCDFWAAYVKHVKSLDNCRCSIMKPLAAPTQFTDKAISQNGNLFHF